MKDEKERRRGYAILKYEEATDLLVATQWATLQKQTRKTADKKI